MPQVADPRTRTPSRSRNQRDAVAEKFNPFNPSAGVGTAERSQPRSPRTWDTERRALLAFRARLRGDVAQTDHSLQGSIATTAASPDSVDVATEVMEQDLAVSLLGSASETLEQIDAALDRIDEGIYGRCAECGTRIPSVRLEAIPYATCCVECAARKERLE